MKKRLVSIVVGLLVLGMGGNVWAGNVVAADLNCTNPAGCVQTNELSDGAVTDPKLAAGAVTNGKIADGAVTNSKLADWSVSGSKIVDFSITDTKISSNAVTTAKIADGAVTDAKITGPISASKIEKPANVITVAQSGGDFTSISTALASLADPNTTPTVIEVKPGTYAESFSMKSYVHLQGSGRDVTTLEGKITIPNGIMDVAISEFKIDNAGNSAAIECDYCKNIDVYNNTITGAGNDGVYLNNYDDSGPSGNHVIRDNYITGCRSRGMSVYPNTNSKVIISNNIITGNMSRGIYGWGEGKVKIIGNEITENGTGVSVGANPAIITGNNVSYNTSEGMSIAKTIIIDSNTVVGNGNRGIDGYNSDSLVMTDNVVTNNGGSGITSGATNAKINGNTISGHSSYGIILYKSASLLNNTIVDSGSSDPTVGSADIRIFSGVPSINFNVFDSIDGSVTGSFNVKSDGTPW